MRVGVGVRVSTPTSLTARTPSSALSTVPYLVRLRLRLRLRLRVGVRVRVRVGVRIGVRVRPRLSA